MYVATFFGFLLLLCVECVGLSAADGWMVVDATDRSIVDSIRLRLAVQYGTVKHIHVERERELIFIYMNSFFIFFLKLMMYQEVEYRPSSTPY